MTAFMYNTIMMHDIYAVSLTVTCRFGSLLLRAAKQARAMKKSLSAVVGSDDEARARGIGHTACFSTGKS
jgi:hypothetical protein